MKVVHLVSGDLWAGAEAATFELLRAQQSIEGVDASAIVMNKGTLADRLAAAHVSVEVEPEAGRSFVDLARAIRARLNQQDADLIHAHRYKESLLAALSRRPWVSTQHGRPEPFTGSDRLRATLTGSLDLLAKRLSGRRTIGVSEEVSAWLVPRVGRSRVVTVANGIADPAARVSPAPWSERPMRVGFLGRLSPVKRPLLALDCIAHCAEGVELDLVGDGPLLDAVHERIEQLGIGHRVHVHGHVDDPLALVGSWRAMISTSEHEGHPMSVLEALSLGTPVVYTATGVGDAVGAAAGRSIDPEAAPSDWAQVLSDLVGDASAGETASAAARQRFTDGFDVRRTAERMLEVYRDALGMA